MGVTVEEISDACSVTPMSVHRALRGDHVGKAVAVAIFNLTGIPAENLMRGTNGDEE